MRFVKHSIFMMYLCHFVREHKIISVYNNINDNAQGKILTLSSTRLVLHKNEGRIYYYPQDLMYIRSNEEHINGFSTPTRIILVQTFNVLIWAFQ